MADAGLFEAEIAAAAESGQARMMMCSIKPIFWQSAVERLREFMRSSYLTGNQAARRIGFRDTTIYSWLQGKSTPRSAIAARINAFLDSMPTERAGIMPTGYESREYKNWRGIPKPRRCPFCKKAKGGDSEGETSVSRRLSERRSDWAETGEL